MGVSQIDATDGNTRNWHSAEAGPIRLGSEQHKVLFSRMLLDTHNPYKPAIIDWPRLDPAARERLVSLPIWRMDLCNVMLLRWLRPHLRIERFSEPMAARLLLLE
jgi:hypothetical protein